MPSIIMVAELSVHATQTEFHLNPAACSIGSKATTAERDASPQKRYKSRGSDCQRAEMADMHTSKSTLKDAMIYINKSRALL